MLIEMYVYVWFLGLVLFFWVKLYFDDECNLLIYDLGGVIWLVNLNISWYFNVVFVWIGFYGVFIL